MTRIDEAPALTDEAPDTGRGRPVSPQLPLSLLVLVAMLLTAASLTAVFSDFVWLVPVVVMVTVVLAVGAAFRMVPALRTTGLTVIGQFIVAALLAAVLCAPDALAAGIIPTPAAFSELFAQLAAGIDDIYRTTAPAPSTPGFRTILTVGFGLVAMLVDGLVSDIRAPKVAGILLLLIYIVPVFLAPNELRWWHFATIAAAFLLLMLAPVLTRATLRSPLTSLVAGGLAIALGIGIPVLLPDIAVRPDRNQTAQGDLTVINPFLDLKSDLTTDDDAVAFTYSTDDPLAPPIRLTSVSEFDGRTWMPSEFDLDPFAVAVEGLPAPDGVAGDTTTVDRSAEISIVDLDQQHLPAPYAPSAVEGMSRRWIYDPQTLTIVGNGEITSEAEYTVEYMSVEPSAADLSAAAPVDADSFPDELALPDDLPDVIAETAEEVTAGSANEWEKASALQAYFRSGEFEYSVDAPEDASGDAIADFLTDKQGYCVQFSGAMTAMARTLGIPARIGVGFTAGTETGEGEYEVRVNQAHAWPELYFEDAGWVRFEPTPGGPVGDPPPWTEAGAEDEEDDASPTPEETTEEETDGPAGDEATTEEPTEEAAGEETDASNPTGLLVGIGIAVLVLLALPALLRPLLRSRRLAAPLRADRVWTEIRATGVDFGIRPGASRTVQEQAEALGGSLSAPAREGLATIAAAVDEARYSDTGGEGLGLERSQVLDTVRELHAGLGRKGGRGAALRARIWPSSIFGVR